MIFATDSYLIPIPSQPTQSLYYGASVKRDWFADLLVAQSFENKFSVRAKTFHKTSFCCKNSLRSEINPYHLNLLVQQKFLNILTLLLKQKKRGKVSTATHSSNRLVLGDDRKSASCQKYLWFSLLKQKLSMQVPLWRKTAISSCIEFMDKKFHAHLW